MLVIVYDATVNIARDATSNLMVVNTKQNWLSSCHSYVNVLLDLCVS